MIRCILGRMSSAAIRFGGDCGAHLEAMVKHTFGQRPASIHEGIYEIERIARTVTQAIVNVCADIRQGLEKSLTAAVMYSSVY